MYLFEGMSKKDKIGFIIVFLLMATFFFAMLFFSLGKPSVDYYWGAMILSIIATFFIDKNSSSRGLKFTLILTCFIVYVFCKGVKNIPFSETQLTIIDGVTEGILVYFVAPPLLKISWSVLKFLGLVIQKMSEEETSESGFNESRKYSRYESDDIDFDDWRSSLKKQELEMELIKKISSMEFERAQLITTNNSFLGLNDSHLSQSELDRNRERWRYLSDKITELTLKLQKLKQED